MMLTSAEEATRWLKLQEEVVVVVSAYLAPVKAYLTKCEADHAYVDDMAGVYRLPRWYRIGRRGSCWIA